MFVCNCVCKHDITHTKNKYFICAGVNQGSMDYEVPS